MPDSMRVEFQTRDGVTLRGDFFKAEREGAGIVVMLNGLSLLKEHFTNEFARRFQEAGISALSYDNRNYGSSDGMPRHETDFYRQASDFHDAISAARRLPGVDPGKVVMWGIGHGASVAMMAAGNDPCLRAVVMHVPFPSGRWDARGFPDDVLERAWRERETQAANGDRMPTYVKLFRDWENDEDGDDQNVMIRGKAAYDLVTAAKALSDAAGTPWENRISLQSFLNLAGIEPQDHAHKITQPALYIVHANDPFAPSPEYHRRVYHKMGLNTEFKVVGSDGDGLMDQIDKAIDYQLHWLLRFL
jgi:uncharacterized protein